jgi:hypothetical protein
VQRRSLLISGCKAAQGSYVSGHLNHWEKFLRSRTGGAWNSDEVIRIDACTRGDVLSAVKSLAGADYCVVVSSAPGETRKSDLPWPETQQTLSDGNHVTERELNSGAPRCALFLDCTEDVCKNPKHVIELSESDEHFTASRAAYDAAAHHAEAGLVKLRTNGPSVGEASVLNYLLDVAEGWASEHSGVLDLLQATQLALQKMSQANVTGRLHYLPGRRLRHFPFAIGNSR